MGAHNELAGISFLLHWITRIKLVELVIAGVIIIAAIGK